MAGLILLVVPMLAGLCAPLLAKLEGQDPYTFHTTMVGEGGIPHGTMGGVSWDHWFGLAPLSGADLFTQVVYGIRTSVFIAFGASVLAVMIGAVVGLSMGYLGGWYDALMGRFIDFMFGFPGLLFIIALVIIVPPEFPRPVLLVLVLGLFGWPSIARIIRGQSISIAAREYIEAARSTGAPGRQILFREMLPRLMGLIFVIFAMLLPVYVSSVAGLSFLGIGVKGDTPDLGKLLSDSIGWIYSGADIWYMLFPGAAIFMVVLGATLLGDGVRDAFDVRRDEGQ